jgi:hypothetical protein
MNRYPLSHSAAARATACAAVLVAAAGCATVQAPVMPDFEGFEAFSTPREFDGPGTIYKVVDGKTFSAGKVVFSSMGGGMEVIPKYTSSTSVSLTQLLKTLGASAALLPASVSNNLSASSKVNIESTTGNRARAESDDVVNAALRTWKPSVRPPSSEQYFLIRETIQTRKLTYSIANDWLAGLGLDAQSLQRAGYNGEIKAGSNSALALDASFEQPLNVYYKTQRIVFDEALGAGPGNFTVTVGPMTPGTLGL